MSTKSIVKLHRNSTMIDVSSPNCSQEEINVSLSAMKPLYDNSMDALSSESWDCLMGVNQMQEIIPGVFLGSNSSAQCLNQLHQYGIRHIVCVRCDSDVDQPQITDPNITYLTLNIADSATENIIRFFPKVKKFIDGALARDSTVLVHGTNGNSRSATLVLAYIMEKFGLSQEQAFNIVKQKRASISPNEGFVNQLTEYEPIYRARQTLNNGEPSHDNCRQKRKSEQLSESVDYDLIQRPPSPMTDNNNDEDFYQCPTDFSNNLYNLWLLKN